MSRQYKLRRSPPDHRDRILKPVKLTALPVVVDLRKEMPPVLDQKSLGSCASNATSVILRHLLHQEKQPEFNPSRLYLYYNTRVNIEGVSPKEDSGVYLRDVCKALQKYHVCDENCWPYDIAKFSMAPPLKAYRQANLHKQLQYQAVPQDLQTLKTTLANHLPILIGVSVYESFESEEAMKTGIIPLPDKTAEKFLGGHALALVGYNENTRRFLVQNSWGTTVGQEGFFELPYDYLLDADLAADFWVFTFFE